MANRISQLYTCIIAYQSILEEQAPGNPDRNPIRYGQRQLNVIILSLGPVDTEIPNNGSEVVAAPPSQSSYE